MSFSKRSRKNTPQCYTKPLDSLKNWNNRFFWVDERVFPTAVDWRTNAPKDGMPAENTYSVEAVRALDTHRTPIQKQPEMLLCLVGISRRYYLGDEAYPTFLYDDDRDMDPFNLICALNPTKRGPAGASDQGTMAPEVPPPTDMPATSAPKAGPAEEVAATDPSVAMEGRKRDRNGADGNAHRKVLRKDHADPRPTRSTHEGKSLAAIELGLAPTRPVPVPKNALAGVSDPDPLSFADPPSSQGTAAVGDPKSENASFASAVGSPESGDGVATATEVRTRGQVAEEVRCSSGSSGQKNPSPRARDKKPKSTLEAEAGMKKAAEDMSAGLSQELEDMLAWFSDLQMSNERLSQQVATLQEQVSGEEKLKAAFEEFKRYEDNRVEQRYAKMDARLDARLDALSIDFDEELYPHMLTAIAGRMQTFADVMSAGIAKGMSEGLRHGVEHGQAQPSLESIEAYDPEAEAKYVTALQALKDLQYPLVDQLEGLKDAPIDLTIPVYPEIRDPVNPWACKEEILLADAIAANISRAKKKKKCRILCRTHGVGSAHHAQSDGVPVSVPTVVPQGLALLLADVATQTEFEKGT
uniref:Transposase (Putative), gypsy type n=1 Tax=Tanacetum cinerariifolium TaxID=118510 RepID=A0A699GUT4_TANCI|nr:transposase (putative), gypsy type [Tanacetum cinerariifolium]